MDPADPQPLVKELEQISLFDFDRLAAAKRYPASGCTSPAAIHNKMDCRNRCARPADPVTGRNRELRTGKQGRNPKGEIIVLQQKQGRGDG